MKYKEKVLECLGHFPGKVELNQTVVEQTDYGTHILQLAQYNVELLSVLKKC